MEESYEVFDLTSHQYHIGVLSDVDNKEITFYKNTVWPGGNSYYKENPQFSGMADHLFSNKENQFIRRTITLDSVRKLRNFKYPDLLKIDVQGCEVDILKGSTDILNHVNHLIVELQNVEYNIGAKNYEESVQIIESMGFELVTPRFSMNGNVDGDYHFIKKK
jgi:FkbM family methyltransferase